MDVAQEGRVNERLARESSPYLKSAAPQPVDWHPWSSEAFEKAKREDKPILLDIGAVWCHWCHVMDHESYDDPAVARIINERFVPVKVDRDERPDVDVRYQKMVSVLTGQGGWPLTAFLTPDGRVFYGGTYFPPTDVRGLPSFRTVLESVSDAYDKRRQDVQEQAEEIQRALRSHEAPAPREGKFTESGLHQAISALERYHDPIHGGWGRVPKFPHPSTVELLLVAFAQTGNRDWSEMAQLTLEQMRRGGVHDQVGGGFHRYSVDQAWHVPHFEKMLYDNAELLGNYVLAWKTLLAPAFKLVAQDIVRFLTENLSDPRGGFLGSQDADVATGDDGDYFTWTRDEVRAAVGDDDLAKLVFLRFGVEERGPMHHNPQKNVLRIVADVDEIAAAQHRGVAEVEQALGRAMDALRAARKERKAPFIDPTLYTNWNAMAIRSYLEFAAAFGRDDAEAFALKTLDRFLTESYEAGRGFAHTIGGRPTWGLLDDNAQMLVALVAAFNHTQDRKYLARAQEVTRVLLTQFWDEGQSAFLDTSKGDGAREDVATLRSPEVPLLDSPGPSGNARVAEGLLALSDLTGDSTLHRTVEKLLDAHSAEAAGNPLFGSHLLTVCHHFLHPPPKIVVAGRADDPTVDRLRRVALSYKGPAGTVLVVTDATGDGALPAEAKAFAAGPARKQAGAMVCLGQRCLPPSRTESELKRALAPIAGASAPL